MRVGRGRRAPRAPAHGVGVGVIRTMAELDLELRLLELHTAVTALLREHRPDVVAIERVFTQNNKGTAMGTAQAAGVAALAAAQADRPVAWHTPSEVKAAISGNGRADKEQVTLMVTRVLGLPPRPSRPTPPTPWRWPSATPGAAPRSSGCAGGPRRRHRRAGPADDAAALDGGGGPMIASRQRPGGRGLAGRRRGRGRRHRPGRAVHPRHASPGCRWASSARLSTSLVVREDSLTLYGFADDDERSLFELLQTANGVGPRLAQAVLAIHPPREVRRAVVDGRRQGAHAGARHRQEGRRAADPGAARPARRHDVGHLARRPAPPACRPSPRSRPWRDQLRPALVGLGWSVKEADGAIAQLARSPTSRSRPPAPSRSPSCCGRRCSCWVAHEHALRPAR